MYNIFAAPVFYIIKVVRRVLDEVAQVRGGYLVNRQITKNGERRESLFDVCYGGRDGKGWVGTVLLHKKVKE